jgi:hypothetical protein
MMFWDGSFQRASQIRDGIAFGASRRNGIAQLAPPRFNVVKRDGSTK